MKRFVMAAVGVLTAFGFAAPAFADEQSDLKSELEAMRRRLESQERRIREMEGTALTPDEVSAAVDRYVSAGPVTASLVGGGADGSAGFPLGKKPFIKEGPNKIEFAFRNQVRYEWFKYSDDAVGTLSDAGFPVSDAAPRDRSGFEIERLYFGLDGTVFCPDITFKLELNFDSDAAGDVEKRYAYIDWKYVGEHHVRAGGDKVAYCAEENHSSSVLAFVDRSIVTKAFEIGFDTGLSLWGYFQTGCDCPKGLMYKVQISNGEGLINRGSVFNTDAFDTYADNLLVAAMLEYNITCNDWKMDEVDHRPCDKRCKLDASVGVAAYYENDDDAKRDQWGGLRIGTSGRGERIGLDAWFRAQYNGWSLVVEWMQRDLDFKANAAGVPTTAPDQTDSGAQATLHYRFADSNWGVGARYGIIWLDDDYLSITTGTGPAATTVDLEDTITEAGVAVNYFFYDHNNKLTFDVNWIQDNSGVNSSSAGYLARADRGVVIEDGLFFRLQWQLNL